MARKNRLATRGSRLRLAGSHISHSLNYECVVTWDSKREEKYDHQKMRERRKNRAKEDPLEIEVPHK